MKQVVAVIFGLGLLCNALLFVPQVIAVWRKKSDEGIFADHVRRVQRASSNRNRARRIPARRLTDPGHGSEPPELRIGDAAYRVLPDAAPALGGASDQLDQSYLLCERSWVTW